MLDIKFIRERSEEVREAIRVKRLDLDLDQLLALDGERSELIQKIDALRKERRENAEVIRSASEDERERLITRSIAVKEELRALEEEGRAVEGAFYEKMLLVPNLPSADTPVGETDADNREIAKWGEPPVFDFPVKSHIELGKALDLLDFEAGAKTAGFRGYYLKNDGVLLQFGVLWLALQKLIARGFTPMIPPTLVRPFALMGSGHFPFGKNEIYQIANPGRLADGDEAKDPQFLAGTSEPSLLAYFADRVLDEKDLPMRVCGFSPCYRSEAGSYGKDTKGLYRVHEFWKVEQVVLCADDLEESHRWFLELRSVAEEILKALELPYRVVAVCTGDMGAGKYEMNDLETWMPSKNAYGETHSNSNLTTWQARRLNVKYKTYDGEKRFVHTLNNTAIASPRILIPLLECHQQADGSVRVPKSLQPFVGKDRLKP